ncbi:MAG TPA: PAS domain S-box protein [Vicinamibacterales bacterium]|nr:PAS domain S-box protein [Vicinamibacterales bacterium]
MTGPRNELPLVRRLAAIVESSDDAIISKDLNGIVMSWNRAAERIFGYTADEMIGRSIRTIVPPDRQSEEDTVLAAIARGEKVDHFETVRRRKDGSLVPISLTVSPVYGDDGRVLGASKIARDITERHEADRLKHEFLATLSHELRTPLNAVLGYTAMLRSGAVAEADAARALDAIARNGDLLRQIVEDLLDVSRMQTGQVVLDVATVDLSEVVERAVTSVLPAALAKGLRIETAGANPVPVLADAPRLQQVFWNLLSNAVKFTDRGGLVSVATASAAGSAVVQVSDTGCGIPPSFLPYVFDRFRQGDAGATRAQRGLGLGLAIARELVELHGGTITARSEGPGHGATFTVVLPVVQRTS